MGKQANGTKEQAQRRPCVGENLIYDKYRNTAPRIKGESVGCFVYNIREKLKSQP